MNYPDMHRIQQTFNTNSIEDIEGAVREEFSKLNLDTRPGQKIAIAVGSRGIHDIQPIVKTAIDCIKERDLDPFILPAMGSHGGATAEGQIDVLAGMGITEDAMGIPVVSSMDVVSLGRLESGADVYFSRDALNADHIVVINRVKPHTLFRRSVESGLCKMLVIGCGKHRGAESVHAVGIADALVPATRIILEKAPILCGIAVLENAMGGTQAIRSALPDHFIETDEDLLKEAWKLFPQIPVEDLDLLIIDEIGKDISGGGMDPNVTGFWRRDGGPRKPDFRTIIVLDVTKASHGNGLGIGWADLTTERVREKLDLNAMYMNAITSGVFRAARVPIALENDQVAIDAALSKVIEPENVRVARIKNTLELETLFVSKAVVPELSEKVGVHVDETAKPLTFDADGRMTAFE